MTTLAVHLFHEDSDEGAAFRVAHEKLGKDLSVTIVPSPLGSDKSVDQMYDHIMGEPMSAISRIDLRGIDLNVAYMTVHAGGHDVILIGDFEADEILNLLSSAKVSGYFVQVNSLEGKLHLTF